MNKMQQARIIENKPMVEGSCIEMISELCQYYETEKLINKILARHQHQEGQEAFLSPLQKAYGLLKESIRRRSLLLDKVKNNNGHIYSRNLEIPGSPRSNAPRDDKEKDVIESEAKQSRKPVASCMMNLGFSKKPNDEETETPIKYPKYKSYFAPLLSSLIESSSIKTDQVLSKPFVSLRDS